MYDDEREQGSMTSFIISSSFYSNEILLKEDLFKERVLFEKTSLLSIASVLMKATEKNETL